MKKLFVVLLLVAASLSFASRAMAQVIIIANSSVKASSISKKDIKEVFTGVSTALSDGSQVVPILLKGGVVHEEFLQAYIGKNDTTYRAGWRSLVFSGQANMPKSLEPDSAVVEFVARNSGTIAYISSASAHEGVKVLAVH
jgi:hypothetical protein